MLNIDQSVGSRCVSLWGGSRAAGGDQLLRRKDFLSGNHEAPWLPRAVSTGDSSNISTISKHTSRISVNSE